MIEVSNLSKSYGNFKAVDDISFKINKGEIFAFLGVNGAGKTTTIRMLVGVLKPSQGQIIIGGHDIQNESLQAKALTGYIPDRPYIYNKLSGREFLYFCADLYKVEQSVQDQRIDKLLEEYSLNHVQNELVESYSHGMKQRIATCAALVHQPQVLIVDEPMVGLDPHGAKFLKESFRKYAAEGTSILLSTHSLNVAEEMADRMAIIQKGKIIAIGTLAEIKAQFGGYTGGLENLFLELTADYKGSQMH